VGQYVDEKAPLYQFATEQGESFVDYDFVEISFPIDAKPVADLVREHSYSESYLDAVVQRANALGITEANVFVMANKGEFKSPRSVSGPGYRLCYMGEFVCRA
jgi:hypothetical protein